MAKKSTKKKATRKKVPSVQPRGKKWVLAVDPFSDISIDHLKKFILPLASTHQAQVIAVYILAPASFNWTGDFSGPWISKYKPLAEEKMGALFSSDPGVQFKVLPVRDSGLRASVKTFLNFAKHCKAERLIVSTHARHGVERWALGSFAETVILGSRIPVLVVKPTQPLPVEVRRILIPTDLSAASQRHVLAMADLARFSGAELVLFYKQPDLLDPIIQQGVYSLGGGWVSAQSFIEEEVAAKAKALENLESRIAKKGIAVRHILDSSPEGLVESINTAIESSHADLVSVLTQSGAWTAVLLGSVARGLLRSAEVPLLVGR